MAISGHQMAIKLPSVAIKYVSCKVQGPPKSQAQDIRPEDATIIHIEDWRTEELKNWK